MTLFFIVLSSLLIGTVVTLSRILRRKSIEVSELNETIKMVRESKERRKQQSLDAINKLVDTEKQLRDLDSAYNNALILLGQRTSRVCELNKKMATAYVVHQVIITKSSKKVLCLAEVIYADSMGKAFAEFMKKRNKRLKDNKMNPAKCGHIQVHRVWKDITTEPHQNL